MVEYADSEIIEDLGVKYPQATIILRVPQKIPFDFVKYEKLSKNLNLVLALEDINLYKECKKHHLKYYWAYPITSFYELEGISKLGVNQVLIGAPLFFDLFQVSLYNKPIRVVANKCFDNYIPREEGICGTYIRPEDVTFYEKFISTIEFAADSKKNEETLLKIYKEDGRWPGNLNLLLTNLNFDVDNRGLPIEFAAARSQCRQSCMRGGKCKFCYTSMKFSRTIDKHKKELSKKLN